jgi:HD-GYP domain-containing protein (c-di-GMP phosphodiesterase class II)
MPNTLLATDTTRRLDAMIERVAMPSLRMPPRDGMRKPSLTWADLQSHLQIAAQCRDEAVKTLGGLVDQLTQGEQVDLANAGQIVRRMFALLQGEPRLASLLMGRQVMEEDYLVLHELNVAWLVMATASWMGIDAQEVRDGGLGALFKDIGMLQVPDEIRLAPRPLSENERTCWSAAGT